MDREKIKHDLLTADFTDVQSETLSYLLAEMATKDDLAMLRTELVGRMDELTATLRGEMAEFRGEMRGEMAAFRSEMRGEMAALRADLGGLIEKGLKEQTWRLIGLVAFISAVLGLFGYFVR